MCQVSGSGAVNRKGCQNSDVRSEPDQEKAAASDKDVNRKKCQSRKGSAVPARRPGVVPIGPPFSLY